MLSLCQIDHVGLGDRFTEAEVWATIRSLPPVPWLIIRADLMAAFNAFWHMDTITISFHSINEALMVLLPKLADVTSIRDYQPISLIHMVGKLFSKILTNRLALKLNRIVHPSQKCLHTGTSHL
jgi:hypothetical protein